MEIFKAIITLLTLLAPLLAKLIPSDTDKLKDLENADLQNKLDQANKSAEAWANRPADDDAFAGRLRRVESETAASK